MSYDVLCETASQNQKTSTTRHDAPHSHTHYINHSHKIGTIQKTRTVTNLTFCNRHKRTHDRGEGAEAGFPLSGEEEDDYSGEDHLGSLEEASPNSEGGYMHSSLNSVAHGHNHGTPTSNGMMPATSMSQPTFNSLQTLSMPMTMSTPAGAMM